MHELPRRCSLSTTLLSRTSLTTSLQGLTRFLLIKIPYFREVLIESFECPHCNHSNKTVKSAGSIQPLGSKYTLMLDNEEDFQRAIVKSETGCFRIEDFAMDMPVGEGQYTNVEGILIKVLKELEQDQPERKEKDPDLHNALDTFIHKLIKMMNGCSFPFTISLDDPTGNSWIEFSPADSMGKYHREDYRRTQEQNAALGLREAEEAVAESSSDPLADVDIIDGQVYEFPSQCPACTTVCTVNMQKVSIPHFKEVIIMSTACEACGYRDSDVKTGGAIPEKGKRITLQIKSREDLSRDILKSETCALRSGELGLDVQPGTLGGRFTTVEGLLTQVRDQLHGQIFDTEDDAGEGGEQKKTLQGGDSMDENTKQSWTTFFDRLDKAIAAAMDFSIILTDPLANSYVQDLGSEDEADPQIKTEEYERTQEEMEDLGLNDMRTEGYEADTSRTQVDDEKEEL